MECGDERRVDDGASRRDDGASGDPFEVSLPLPPTAVGVAPRTQEKEYQNVASGRLKKWKCGKLESRKMVHTLMELLADRLWCP